MTTLSHSNFLQLLHDQLLNRHSLLNSPSFTAAALERSHNQNTFYDIIEPTHDLIDIMVVHIPLEDPYALIVGAAIKFAIRRFALPIERGYYFDKDRLWEKNLLSPQEIVQNIQKEFAHVLQTCHLTVSIFYGRFNLPYRTFTYLNCGLGSLMHMNQEQKLTQLSQKWTSLGATNSPLASTNTLVKPGDWFIYCQFENGERELISSRTSRLLVESLKTQLHLDAPSFMNFIEHHLPFNEQSKGENNGFVLALKINENLTHISPRKDKTAMFSSDISQLSALRLFVREICQQAPSACENFGAQVLLAINELFCNIVKYAYHNLPKGEILIESQYVDDGICFTLSDRGTVFNPLKINHPNLAGEQESGFGFFIVQQIADHISYIPKKTDTDWNHIRIFKRYFSEEDHMELVHHIQDNLLVIAPKGDHLDAKNAASFKEDVLKLIHQTELINIILNLTHLQFIDSSGLGALLSLQRVLHTQGGSLKLTHLNKSIRTLFEIVSMHRIFDIFNTVDEAIQSFK